MPSNRALRLNITANYFGKGWEALMGLLFLPFYVRYLGPESYGIVGFVALIQTWISLLDMGMTPTLTREMARYRSGEKPLEIARDILRSFELMTFALAGGVVLFVWLLSGWLADHWLESEALSSDVIASALWVGAFVIALRFCESVYRGVLYGLQRQVNLNIIAAIMATFRGAGAMGVLLFISTDIRTFLGWQALVSLATIVALAASSYLGLKGSERRARFSLPAIKDIAGFAGGVFVTKLLVLLVSQVDKILLSSAVTLETFGYYMFAMKAATIVTVVSAPILSALYPQFVGHAVLREKEQERDLFRRWSVIICAISGAVTGILFHYGPQVVFVWSGDRALAEAAGPLLAVLALGTFLHVQAGLPYQVQLAHGWTLLGFWSNASILALFIPAILMLLPIYGALGVAWIRVGVMAGYILLTAIFMFRRLLVGERTRWLIRDLGVPVACTVAVMVLIDNFVEAEASARWIWLAIFLAAGVLSGAASLVAGGVVTVQSLVRLSRRLRALASKG